MSKFEEIEVEGLLDLIECEGSLSLILNALDSVT